MQLSNSEKVREFSNGASMCSYEQKDGTIVEGKELPNNPTPADKEQVVFLTKMIVDELVEFLATVTENSRERAEILKEIIGSVNLRDDLTLTGDETPAKIIEDQADALVDIEYYSKDFAAKRGVNLCKMFDIVHKANMDKRNEDGNFVKRHDGKVIKPEGWKSPNVSVEIERQIENGAFNQ